MLSIYTHTISKFHFLTPTLKLLKWIIYFNVLLQSRFENYTKFTKTNKNNHHSPVHRERKFLHVLGQISEKSWKTMRPTTNTKEKHVSFINLLVDMPNNKTEIWFNFLGESVFLHFILCMWPTNLCISLQEAAPHVWLGRVETSSRASLQLYL